jgi:N-acetylmuramoyl-L-alanine amidase
MKILSPNVLRSLIRAAALFMASAALAEASFSSVVIDPGHGGFDRGGILGQRVPEKTVALETALRLQWILQRAGLRTIMTRTTDVFIPLPKRVAIANAQPNSIFVSIHYNASPRQGAHGIETYSGDSRGRVLAARIQREIISRVSTENRGIRHAEYFVLRNCRKPAVLVECGFLTNPYEAQLAQTAHYQQEVAEQIAAGILDQRKVAFPSVSRHRPHGRVVHHTHRHHHYAPNEKKNQSWFG